MNERNVEPTIGQSYYGHGIFAVRISKTEGVMNNSVRTSKSRRQEIADTLATITETATVTETGRNTYRIDFKVTHQIVPLS